MGRRNHAQCVTLKTFALRQLINQSDSPEAQCISSMRKSARAWILRNYVIDGVYIIHRIYRLL